MKAVKFLLGLFLALGISAQGAVFYPADGSYWGLWGGQWSAALPGNGVIPDGNQSGWSDTRTVSGLPGQITEVTVFLNIEAGFTGDLYAYLSHDNVLVPLINRVGVTSGDAFGYADHGIFSFELDDAAGNGDIHTYRRLLTGAPNGSRWQPDGRTINPLSDPAAFDTASRVGFSSFYNLNPNGDWTLFLADLSTGGTSRLEHWELSITAVPEPVNVALGIFGGVALFGLGCRSVRRKKLK